MKGSNTLSNKLRNLLAKIIQRSASIRTNTASSKLPEQTLPDFHSKNTFHRSCQTLKYDSFVRILMGAPLSLLTISGFPTDEELAEAWDEIQQEYSTLIVTQKTNSIFELYKKISRTNFLIKFLSESTALLKSSYSLPIAQEIEKWGYDFIEEDVENRRGNLKQIYRVEGDAKTLIVILNQYSNQYKILCPDETAPVERTLMDYDKELAILSRFQHRWLKRKKITVWEFCTIVNAYNDYHQLKRKEDERSSV